jgi:hypothetical protein
VVDILDELNMLMLLFERQVDVLTLLQGKLPDSKPMTANIHKAQGYNLVLNNTRVDHLQVRHKGNAPGSLVLDDSRVGHIELMAATDSGTGVAAVGGNAGTQIYEAEQKLKGVKVNVERMRSDARQTHQMVRTLR